MAAGSESPLRIGVTACVLHNDPDRVLFNGRRLLYLEYSMADWIMAAGALPFLIPFASGERDVSISLKDYVHHIDGLVVHGGADVSPRSYGEEPMRPEWSGDSVRDAYEIELIKYCIEAGKPVLGICRGHQVLNVALGGTLYQDIQTQIDGSFKHRCADKYQNNRHEMTFVKGSRLSQIYEGKTTATINSVHHQAIKTLGDGLVVEALSKDDDVIEAVRWPINDANTQYVAGVQWHPEFQDPADSELLDAMPVLYDFLEAAKK